MLHAQGLNANGGVIGKNSHSALKEPLPLTYIRQDVRPGIGFRDSLVNRPQQERGGGLGGRGERGGRGRGRGH
jgi:hypothetical protein